MFPRSLRFALIAASFGYGLYSLSHGQPAGVLWLFGSALLIYGYFRYGPVWLAFRHIRKKNFDDAATLLAQVKNPNLLSRAQRGYFEFASALLAMNQGKNTVAERHIRTALDHRLRSDNDRALAETLLAQLLIEGGGTVEARDILHRARQRTCSPQVAKAIEQVVKSLPDTPAERDVG